nr:RNA-binding protein 1 isoform X1 [Megalopta genalis]
MSRYREWDLSCKVYVGNLGSSASKHEIESAFSKYGPLRNVWVARNPPGFAFVEFEDPRDAEDAVRGLDGTRCCGTRVRVEMSSGRSRRAARRPGPRYSRSRSRSSRKKSIGHYPRSLSRSPHRSSINRYSRSRSRSPRRRSLTRSRSRDRRSRSDSRDRR